MFTTELVHTVDRVEHDGTIRKVKVSIPVDWPPVVVAAGERFRHVRQGYRLADGAPAGLYANDSNDELWYCEGRGYWA